MAATVARSMPDRLHIRLLSAEVRQVRLEGELDVGNCDKLTTFLEALGTAGDLFLDTSRLDFIDSTGLNTLLTVDQAHRHAGSQFVIVNPSAPLTRLLGLTNLGAHFVIEP